MLLLTGKKHLVKREAFNDYEVEFDDLKPQRVSKNSEESMINYNDNYDVPNTDNEYYDAYDGDYTESTTNLMDASDHAKNDIATYCTDQLADFDSIAAILIRTNRRNKMSVKK